MPFGDARAVVDAHAAIFAATLRTLRCSLTFEARELQGGGQFPVKSIRESPASLSRFAEPSRTNS